jgi:TonB family protein
MSRPPIAGSGLYRVTFSATGEAKSVQVVQSTGSGLLDAAAGKALRRWKCSPGQEWTTNVPITFGR